MRARPTPFVVPSSVVDLALYRRLAPRWS